MSYIKTFGPAAVAAMGLMAFLGAGSASATVLCNTTTTPCNSKLTVGTPTEFSLGAGISVIWRDTSNTTQDQCTGSMIKDEITNAGGASSTVVSKVTKLEFTGCTNTTVVNNAAACEFEVHSITGSSNGTVTAKGCTVTVVTAGVDCTLGASTGTDLGTLTEGNPATLDVNATLFTVDGDSALCPASWRVEAKFVLTGSNTIAVEPE